jgi:hypothetical protein
MMGININDECQDFTGQILRGEKTIETRKTRSLDPYIGERVGLVRTGVGKATLVGYATIGDPVVYDSVAKFRRDYEKHLVAPGSAFDIKDGLKYGYPLMQVESVEPKEIESRGIVARKLNPKNRQTDTPEFERWFGDSKVVDESGEPLVVYHGTSKDKPFSSFTRNAQGTWFTSSPEAASSYAMTNDSQKVVYEGGKYVSKNTSSHVIPVYLSIQNPLMVEGELLEKWRRAVNYRAANKMMVVQAKYAGHDGLVFRDGVFVVFEPTQIKSAIGNKGTFDPEDSNITNPYTRPDLRDRLKRKIMAGDKGGNPGQWSARKAQLLAAEYERAGGGYSGKRSASQKSLSKWTKEDWRTKSGKPSLETGERYLPAAAITALTSAEYAETSRAKRKATGQFSRQPKRIAMKTSEYRNPMTNAVRKKLAPVIEKDDRILCYDTASGEDFYRLWDIIHTAMPMTKEALVEVEGMLDDDGVLVIESGESPAGLQDHFRKATRYNGLLLVQGPKNPEEARIETEKLRRELE